MTPGGPPAKPIQLRVGLNSGEVVVRTIGSDLRKRRIFVCMSMITGCASVTRVESGAGLQLAVDGRTYDEVWRAAVIEGLKTELKL